METSLVNVVVQIIILGAISGSIYSLFAIGLTLAMGAGKMLNIAHGDIGILGAYICYTFIVLHNFNFVVALILSLAILIIIGVFLQKFIINIAVRDPKFQITATAMITYGLALLISNLEILSFGPDYRSLTLSFSYTYFSVLGVTLNLPRVIVLVVTLCVVFILLLFFKTKQGKAILAVTQDRKLASLVGVNSNRIMIHTFGIAVTLAGLAGTLYILNHTMYPAVGLALNVKALSVMVLGGIGSITGAFIGGILLGMAETVTSFFIGDVYAPLVSFLILLIVILIRPRGLLGKEYE